VRSIGKRQHEGSIGVVIGLQIPSGLKREMFEACIVDVGRPVSIVARADGAVGA